VLARCHLANRSEVDLRALADRVGELNARVDTAALPRGFIEELYAPADEANITPRDRVFYTKSNARRLDNYRRLLDDVPDAERTMLLGPLLSRASVHANTAGVFKGFYKNRRTRRGQFGGSGSDALGRILGAIVLDVPVLSRFECEVDVFRRDANALARELRDLDVAYLDPPYNQHPYGSNYFMLNLVATYRRPADVSPVSGIPADWQRSGYNVRSRSLPLLCDLAEAIDAKFLIVSFNDEGFIAPAEMRAMLERIGTVDVMETRYNAFRGSRSFDNRPIHVTEQLFLVEKR
jgi:adenine-specific DNA-methyltransferase